MPYDAHEVFRSAAALAHSGLKIVKIFGVRDDGSCTCRLGRQCSSPGKHPAGGDGWQYRATDNEEEIANWFDDVNENLRWNIGVLLGGASGIIDVEADNEDALKVVKDHGLDKIDTLAYMGSRGPHYWFQHSAGLPDGAVVHVGALEVRLGGRAAQSVVPPSWHASGVQYQWMPGRSPDETRVAPLPPEFIEVIKANSRKAGSGVIAQSQDALLSRDPITAGGRHAFLLGRASDLFRHLPHFTETEREAVLECVRALNVTRCRPPKDDAEVINLVNSQFKYYADRRLERNGRRPLEQTGLIYDDQRREWLPGGWRMTIIRSDPVKFRLRIPASGRMKSRLIVLLSGAEFNSPKAVAVRVMEASGSWLNLTAMPNAKAWAMAWSGGTIEVDGEEREVEGLYAKLWAASDEENVQPELKEHCRAASVLLNYLLRFDSQQTDGEDKPHEDGTPKWIGDVLYFKWWETWQRAISRGDPISKETKLTVRSKVLEATGRKEFRKIQRKSWGGGSWLAWTQEELDALNRIAHEEPEEPANALQG